MKYCSNAFLACTRQPVIQPGQNLSKNPDGLLLYFLIYSTVYYSVLVKYLHHYLYCYIEAKYYRIGPIGNLPSKQNMLKYCRINVINFDSMLNQCQFFRLVQGRGK